VPERLEKIQHWLQSQGIRDYQIAPASADASFRRYFRVTYKDVGNPGVVGNERQGTPVDGGETLIVMDAPPQKEDCGPFIHMAKLLEDMGLHVPHLLNSDLQQGFLLLSDLGSEQYLPHLNSDTVDRLYGDAMEALLTMQRSHDPRIQSLPVYDRKLLMTEMELFREWLLKQHLGLKLSDVEEKMLDQAFAWLAESALQQPRVFVHRDYHSRNLMICGSALSLIADAEDLLSVPGATLVSVPDVARIHSVPGDTPGILDFQDAVYGPITYDLVSLLRDCYIDWPREQVENWVRDYHRACSGPAAEVDFDRFLAWFDLMGVQRHFKASGIFARLNHRDGKPGYLKDIPRTLAYVTQIAGDYPPLQAVAELIQEQVLPRLDALAP